MGSICIRLYFSSFMDHGDHHLTAIGLQLTRTVFISLLFTELQNKPKCKHTFCYHWLCVSILSFQREFFNIAELLSCRFFTTLIN